MSIFLLAFFLRTYNINWDNNNHLHPDERFLTMILVDTQLPKDLTNYLDPKTSLLNPVNIGHTFFVYGLFPISLTKIISEFIHITDYDHIVFLGRLLSAIFDSCTVLLIYLISSFLLKHGGLKNNYLPFVASLIYAVTPLAIQQSHFFITDTFVTFFTTLSLCIILYLSTIKTPLQYVLYASFLGISIGLSLASKISAIIFIPFITIIFFYYFYPQYKFRSIILFLGIIAIVYFSLRLGSPYYFASSNIFDISLNTNFLSSMNELKALNTRDAWFPPQVQWINSTPLHTWINLAFILSLPFSIIFIFGLMNIVLSKKRDIIVIIALFTILFLIYSSLQIAKPVRYLLPIYPYLAIIVAYGTCILFKKYTFITLILFNTGLLWTMMFMNIYFVQNTRVTATAWIYNNIPKKATIAVEHWDDALPLSDYGSNYKFTELAVFASESESKWVEINNKLQDADYYVISSNRTYGQIPKAPQRYPQTIQFYKDLFSSKNNYEKVKTFTSYPKITFFGNTLFEFNDEWLDESFSVYDHPVVHIFKNTAK